MTTGPQELQEQAAITCWRQLAKAALTDMEAEYRLLELLNERKGALGDFLAANADQIYRLPPGLRGPGKPPTVSE